MSQAVAERTEHDRKPRFQVGVSAMTVWVLGAAVYFAMVRGARGFWMVWMVPARPLLNIDRVVAVFLLAPATLIAARLVADAIGQFKRRGSAFVVAWRVVGVAFLVLISVMLSTLLKLDRETVINNFDWIHCRLKLTALLLAFGTIGLLLGVVSPREKRRARHSPRRRWVAASVIVAGLAGVLVVAYWGDMLIPYLIVVALEAVSNAKHHPGMMTDWALGGHTPNPILIDASRWLSLDGRIIRAGIEAAVAIVACMLTAHWLGRDLRLQTNEARERTSQVGRLYRFLTAVAAWGMGFYLIRVAIPGLHPNLTEGLWMILEPSWTFAIVAGFLALAAGLAARGVGGANESEIVDEPQPTGDRMSWLAWTPRLVVFLFKLAVAGLLIELILTGLERFRDSDTLPWYAPYSLTQWISTADGALSIERPNAIYFDPSLMPDAFFLLGAAIILIVLAIRFLRTGRREAPIDRIGRDPRLIRRFLGAWLAITGVMLALLPAFFLAGFAVLHLTMKAAYP
jgi:hypothetical protein